MKNLVYLVSGIVFGLGLSLSEMIDPIKVKSFLAVGFDDWDPSLIFVLGAAVIVYAAAFFLLRYRGKTLNGNEFKHPKPRPIDKKLILGSVIFGIGWGIAGICPGPSIVHIAFLDTSFALFIAAMVGGFELHRRLG